MKLFKIVFLLSFLVSPLSYSQWWVSGGNLLWTHGNVSITNGALNLTGDLGLSGNLNFSGNRNLSITSSLTLKDQNGNNIGLITGAAGFGLSISLGDYTGYSNNVYLSIDDNEVRTTNLITNSLSIPGIIQGLNLSDPPVISELEVFDTSPEGFISIIQDTNTSKYYFIYKVSNGEYLISEMQRVE